MLVIHDVFQLKFGKAREARALLDKFRSLVSLFDGPPARAMMDMTGPAYTLLLETQAESLAAYETMLTSGLAQEEWQEWYAQFVPLVESSHRTIYRLVD